MELFKLVGSIFIKSDDANRELDNITNKASRTAQDLGKSVQNVGDNMQNVGRKIMPVSAVVGGVLGVSTKSALEFQDSVAKVSTLVDTTKTPVKNLSNTFLDLSNKTGVSATELAEAGYQALSAGVSVNKLGKFTETATNLSKVGFTSASSAVDILTTVMNAYGDSAGTADEISNKLIKTQNLGKTTVDELAGAMGRVIPTASAMGVNIDNLSAGYVSLTKQGIATNEATTYMNAMLNELGDTGSKVSETLQRQTGKSFAELMAEGNSLGDVLGMIGYDTTGLTTKIQDLAAEGLTTSEAFDQLKNSGDADAVAFANLWGSAEAGKAGLAILNGGIDEFNGTVAEMGSKTDVVAEGLEKLNTPSAKMKKSLNQLKNAGIELGTAFLSGLSPILTVVCGGITVLTTAFNAIPTPIQAVIAGVMALIAVAGPVLLIGGKLVSGVGSLIVTFPKLLPVITSIGGGLSKLFAIMMANPIALVVAAIAALVAGFVYLWNTSESFRNFWIGLWDNIKNVVTTVWNAIKSFLSVVWEGIKTAASGFATVFKTIFSTGFNAVKTVITTVWNGIKTFLSAIWNGIKTVATTYINLYKTIFTTGFNIIKTVVTTVWNAIKSFLSTVWNGIKTIFSGAVNFVKNIISTGFNGIKSVVSGIMNGIKTVFSNVWNGIKTVVTGAINIIKGAIGGLSSAFNAVKSGLSAVLNVFRTVWNGAKNVVSGAISKIKSIMNFKWSLPKIKLPHFSISGKFSVSPPSIPKFKVSWYKGGGIMTEPTLFDYNPATGHAKVGGEAGDEAIAPIELLKGYVAEASASQNYIIADTLEDLFGKLFSMLQQYFPEFSKPLVLDTGALVGGIAPAMDKQLGIISSHKDRGNK